MRQKLSDGPEGLGTEGHRPDEPRKGVTDRHIMINAKDNGDCIIHNPLTLSVGSINCRVMP
jgi:hypothetical protein